MAPASARIPALLRQPETAALALLVLAVAGAHAHWILRNAAPMPHPQDPYYYLARTIEFADALRAGSAAGLREAFSGLATAGRFPLYQLLATPFVLAFGRSVQAALLLNAMWWVVLLLATYGMGKCLAGWRAGLLAGVVTAAFPPLVHMSHVYRPRFALSACVAASLWLLLRLHRRPSVGAAWATGASLGLAFAMHPTAAWSLAFPAAAVWLHLVFFDGPPGSSASRAALVGLAARLTSPLLWRGLAPAAVVAVAPTLAWYASFGARVVAKAGNLASGDVIVLGFPGVEPSFGWYLRTAPGALSNVLAAFGGLALVAALLRRERASQLLAWSVLVGLLVLSLTWLRVWWYATPLLPPLAALIGAFVVRLRPAGLARVAGAVCAAASVAVFVLVFHAPAGSSGMARALGAPLDSSSCANLRPGLFCPGPAEPAPWPVPEILARVQTDDPSCASAERRCRLFLVGPNRFAPGPMLGRGLLSYEWVRGWPGTRLEVLGIHRGNCGIDAFPDSQYLLTLEPAPDRPHPCTAAWAALLREPPLFFARNWRELGTFRLPDGRSARLRRRVGDWTVAGRARFRRALVAHLPETDMPDP